MIKHQRPKVGGLIPLLTGTFGAPHWAGMLEINTTKGQSPKWTPPVGVNKHAIYIYIYTQQYMILQLRDQPCIAYVAALGWFQVNGLELIWCLCVFIGNTQGMQHCELYRTCHNNIPPSRIVVRLSHTQEHTQLRDTTQKSWNVAENWSQTTDLFCC